MTKNNIREDRVKSECDESPVSDIRIMIIMFTELEVNIQNNSLNCRRIWIKKQKHEKTQKEM
jgi:hypothetical protein